MHERRNNCLLTGNKFMLKMYLRQPEFTMLLGILLKTT